MTFALERIDSADSTSSELIRRIEAGLVAVPAPGAGLALLARRQSGGRGRLGRRWESIEGNLFLSVAVAAGDLRQAGHWSLLAGVALIESLALPGARLKWPNDVVVAGRKLAGILVETAAGRCGTALVVGVGVNVAAAPEIGRPVTCLAELGHGAAPDIVGVAFLGRFFERAAEYRTDGFGPVRAAWLDAGPAVGSPLDVQHGAERLQGAFAGLREDGALLLKVGTQVVAVSGGEVVG